MMRCDNCSEKTMKCYETRMAESTYGIRRREYRCPCGYLNLTYEFSRDLLEQIINGDKEKIAALKQMLNDKSEVAAYKRILESCQNC